MFTNTWPNFSRSFDAVPSRPKMLSFSFGLPDSSPM